MEDPAMMSREKTRILKIQEALNVPELVWNTEIPFGQQPYGVMQ